MSSPANLANMFSVRIAAIALSVTGMALLLSTPFVDVLVIGGGIRWLSAFGVVIADWPLGRSRCDRDHGIAVPADRPQPHTAGGADPRRRHRRRLRHRAPGRRDPFLRHAVALCRVDLGCRGGLRARARQSAVVAGARRDRRWRGAVAADGRRARAARRRDGDLLAAICRHRRQRHGDRTGRSVAAPRSDRISRRLAAAGAACQGVPAAAARSLAGVAEPDAIALSGAAGPDAVAKFFGKLGRDRADHARDRDGGGTARRRSRLADDFRRGRRRPGRDRADAAIARHPRQGRSRADRRSPRSSRR